MGMEVIMNPAPFFPHPLNTPGDADKLRQHVDVEKELGYVFNAIAQTRTELAGEVPLIGFCGAPWTLFGYMVEGGGSKTLQKAKTWLYKYPEESKALLMRIADVCVDFLVGQVKAGAQASVCDYAMSSSIINHLFSSCKYSIHGPESCHRMTLPPFLFLPSFIFPILFALNLQILTCLSLSLSSPGVRINLCHCWQHSRAMMSSVLIGALNPPMHVASLAKQSRVLIKLWLSKAMWIPSFYLEDGTPLKQR